MSWSVSHTYLIPDAALYDAPVMAALHEVRATVTASDDGTARCVFDDSPGSTDLDHLLRAGDWAYDHWHEDPGTGEYSSAWGYWFRPARDGSPVHDTQGPVLRDGTPVLSLNEWNKVAAVTGGPITLPDVRHYLGLPRESLAAWAKQLAGCPQSLRGAR